MYEAFSSFLTAFILGGAILRFQGLHERVTGDTGVGPQKIHSVPVPRIGGLTIFVGFLIGVCLAAMKGRLDTQSAGLVVLCSVPAFAGGFYEDISKRGSVLLRLTATFISAGLAFWWLGARLDRLDFPLADTWLQFGVISILFTMFAAGGVSQSINIIDGLNGLASFIGMTILGAIGVVAWQIGDQLVLTICLAGAGGILGFFVWNYPRGKVFCGDGGAYFIGFVIAETSVLIVHRHAQVSAWFPLLLAAYPVWETTFSMYRRRVLLKKAATQPDALHLHSLVYRWLILCWPDDAGWRAGWRRNAASSAVCWILQLFAAGIALAYWRNTLGLTIGAFAFAAVYLAVYIPLTNKRLWRFALKAAARRRRERSARGELVAVGRIDQPI